MIAFTSYGLYTIQDIITQWEENVTITTIKNYSADVRDIQFPTVTICPNGWSMDRYGFVRAYLNEYDLTKEENLKSILQEWKFYLDEYYNIFQEVLEKNAFKIDLMVRGDNHKKISRKLMIKSVDIGLLLLFPLLINSKLSRSKS